MTPEPRPSTEAWERSLDRAFKQLPERPAPASLLPTVLARIQAQAAAPWYQRAWWDWPVTLRAASIAVLAGLVALLIWGSGAVWTDGLAGPLSQWLGEGKVLFTSLANALQTLLAIGGKFYAQGGRLVLLSAGLLWLAMYLTCLAAGTAVYRVSMKRSL